MSCGRWVEQEEAAGMTAADADKLTERDGRGIGMMMNVSRKYQRKLPCTEASRCRFPQQKRMEARDPAKTTA